MTADQAQQVEYARIRGYLQSQGEKYSLLELWPRATKARLELLDALEGVTESQADFKPAADEWSVREVALHVLRGSRNGRALVGALAVGTPAPTGAVDPPRESTATALEELRAELRRDGAEWAAAILPLPQRPPLTPTAPHSMFGELHARAWYLFQRTHDLDHASQITAIKGSAGYPAEGA